MNKIDKLKAEKEELLNALKDANNLLCKNVGCYKLDCPKYWKITEVLEKNGHDVNHINNLFNR